MAFPLFTAPFETRIWYDCREPEKQKRKGNGMIGIGIDTGGTCTDAVIYNLNTREILAVGKTLTTKENLEIGIAKALDTLPAELLQKAENFALSTTLATNACVENKGSRAKLLVMGITPEMLSHLEQILFGYGINDISQLIVLDAKAENLYSDPLDPDWEMLKKTAPELFADCDCVGIVQTYPDANAGRFEITALRLLEEELTIPLTTAYEISKETDILKVCASTLLNARLIPLITEFMEAVHHVMESRNLKVPLSIVRSDGSLMSEEMAKTCPVETLLCGPAASVIGGLELAQEKEAIVVDMGGTTTDIALIRDSDLCMAEEGIFIGQYKTSIKGLDAQAISLGGDTAVRFAENELFLDTERIVPVSVLAARYETVLPALRDLLESKQKHTRWIHEFFVLQKDISDKSGYTDYERRVCEVLKDGPLIAKDFARRLESDLYHLGTERLEQEGVIIRSGLTPTDIMVLKGDLKQYAPEAAEIMIRYIEMNIHATAQEIPDLVYTLVTKRMYKSIAAFVLRRQYPRRKEFLSGENMETLTEMLYQQADMRVNESDANPVVKLDLTAPMPLIGIGAPVHVFLPRVARLLHTDAIVPEYAYVANALGAVAGQLTTRVDVIVKAHYNGFECTGYSIAADCKRHMFANREDAVAFGQETALEAIRKRAAFQGLGEDPEIELKLEEKRLGNRPKGLLFEVIVHAIARARE